MSNNFSERLKRLRGNRRKADFARELGLSAPAYQRYEDGRVPRADVLADISHRLSMTVEELLSGNDQGAPIPGAKLNPEIRKSGRAGVAYPETAAVVGSGRTGEPAPCAGCASRDALIAELRSQVGMLIKANAALADAAGAKHRAG